MSLHPIYFLPIILTNLPASLPNTFITYVVNITKMQEKGLDLQKGLFRVALYCTLTTSITNM